MGAEHRILDVKDALAQARSLFRIATPREQAHEQPREQQSTDPTPPPMAAAGPAASAARLRGAAVERELSILAAELGTGRDAALVRALGFYRRFARKARRAGQAPEEFLRALCLAQGRGDVRSELSEIRSRLDAITRASTSIAITTTAPAPEPVASITYMATSFEQEPVRPARASSRTSSRTSSQASSGAFPDEPRGSRASALDIFRAARGRRAEKPARDEPPAKPAPTRRRARPAATQHAFFEEVATPPPPATPAVVQGSTAALAARMAGFGPLAEAEKPAVDAGTGTSTSASTSTSTSAPPPAPSGPSYAERRAKLPKITF